MTKFRWHRGSLAESMETVVDFDGSKEALVVLLKVDAMPWFPALEPEHVAVEPYCYDERIGWDSHMVTVMGGAIGFTDGPLAIEAPKEAENG